MGKIHFSNKIRTLKTLRTYAHRSGLVFQPYGRITIVRSMPQHYNDANSEAQQPCRNKMKWVMQMHSLLKDAYQGCFQGEKSDYHLFRQYNMLSVIGNCFVSHGSLPSLNTHVVDNYLELDLKEEEWRSGDILRFVSLPDDLQHPATYHDTIITAPKTETVATEELPPGYYCYIHLRPSRKKIRASTQTLTHLA